MSTEKGGTQGRLRLPVEEMRKALLADKDTQHIAKTLGVPVEEYVEKVLDYAQHPEKEPVVSVVQDENALKAQYPDAKTTPEIVQELQKFVSGEATFDTGNVTRDDGFEAAKTPKVDFSGGPTQSPSAAAKPGSALQDQVQRQLKKDQNPKG